MRLFCILFDIGMSVIMFIIGILFYKSNGKGANFLSGYNTRSTEERKQYDEKGMCRLYGKRMIYMAIPFFVWSYNRYLFCWNWMFDCLGIMADSFFLTPY